MTATPAPHEHSDTHPAKHPHLHAVADALAAAGEAYGDAIAGLVLPTHAPGWTKAVEEYDRTHPRQP
ncbi:MAG: hypothetical protein ACXVGH_08660 [Mycobacteriales bacterium]